MKPPKLRDRVARAKALDDATEDVLIELEAKASEFSAAKLGAALAVLVARAR